MCRNIHALYRELITIDFDIDSDGMACSGQAMGVHQVI
jgi:hypothetical protein